MLNMIKTVVAFLLLSWFIFVPRAYAVIPSLTGPLQSLLAVLPQLLMFLVAALGVVFSLWKLGLARLKNYLVGHKALSAMILLVLAAAIVSTVVIFSGRSASKSHLSSAADSHSQASAARFPSAWPTFRGDMTRSGNPTGSRGPLNPQISWVFKDEEFKLSDFASSPAVVGGKIYVGAAQGTVFSSFGLVYCLKAEDGQMLWKFKTKYEIFSSPVVVEGRVYIGEGLHRHEKSRLYCLDAETSELIWDFQTQSHVESSPTVIDGKLIFGAGGDGVYCLDAKTGREIWHFSGIHVDLSPAVSEGKVLVGTGYDQMGVYCLDLKTGALLWRRQTRYPVWGSPAIYDGKAYFGLGNGNFIESDPNPYGALLCLDLDSQRERWKYEVVDAVLTSAAVAEGKVYFGSRDGRLYCLDAKSGKLIWQYETGAPILSSSAVAGDLVYFGAQQGKIYALNRSTGELKWEQDLSKITSTQMKILASPAAASGQIYIGGSNGMFFSFGEDSEAQGT